MMTYPVIIHLDSVVDYRPPPPASSSSNEWPRTYDFTWHLGVPDGVAPPPHTRETDHFPGDRKRDRSPGGNGRRGGASEEDTTTSARRSARSAGSSTGGGGGPPYCASLWVPVGPRRWHAVSRHAAAAGTQEAEKKTGDGLSSVPEMAIAPNCPLRQEVASRTLLRQWRP
ncbi:hypothetical protein BS78_07G168200 [Paspalum vaginatum]|nr:hypothetical protein BS78_07G168200 [Paspalum vaginatum]